MAVRGIIKYTAVRHVYKEKKRPKSHQKYVGLLALSDNIKASCLQLLNFLLLKLFRKSKCLCSFYSMLLNNGVIPWKSTQHFVKETDSLVATHQENL